MNAEVIPLPVENRPRICVPCLLIWMSGPVFWVGVLAVWVMS